MRSQPSSHCSRSVSVFDSGKEKYFFIWLEKNRIVKKKQEVFTSVIFTRPENYIRKKSTYRYCYQNMAKNKEGYVYECKAKRFYARMF